MKTALQDLIQEHKAIQVALNILEKIREKLENTGEADPDDINDLLGFLKEFADKCHHGKEEGFLFPALEKTGVANEGGPIGVMLAEHTSGRSLIKHMQESIKGNHINKPEFIEASLSYIRLLRVHIMKENAVLFPLINSRLSAPEQNELEENFEKFEEKVIGEGRHEAIHALLEKFETKYLADAV
jgi:hemerythrin-like domain-containing protein